MISNFVFISFVTSIQCSDICSFLETNDSSVSIGIEHKLIRKNDSIESKYLLFREDLTQMYEMNIDLDDKHNVVITFDEESDETNQLNVTQRFSLVDVKSKQNNIWNCYAIKIPEKECDYTGICLPLYRYEYSNGISKHYSNFVRFGHFLHNDVKIFHPVPSNLSFAVHNTRDIGFVKFYPEFNYFVSDLTDCSYW